MKIIFLDHDGVICLSSEWGSRLKNRDGLDSAFDRFNPKAIKVLNQILDETDAEIVISSDWRFHCTLEQMRELYKIRGVKKLPIAFTRNDLDCELFMSIKPEKELEFTRHLEIKDWLSFNPQVTNWVAVDDLDMSRDFLYPDGLMNFVHTPRPSEGIKQSGIKDKIVNFLN